MSEMNAVRVYQHLSIALLVALCFLIFFIAFNSGKTTALMFGDDSSEFSVNGECSDTRFRGPGMGNISAGIGVEMSIENDASDCSSLFDQGLIFLASESANLALRAIEFGDDEGGWPEDGECDDPRFDGEAVASSADDVRQDATDCRTLLYQGSVNFVGEDNIPPADEFDDDPVLADIDFGDDLSDWANDGECDDPRFGGGGSATTLLDEDALHDAADCSALYAAGEIFYVGDTWDNAGIIERGVLEFEDDVDDETGKYLDSYFFEGSANQRTVFELRSVDFDTYLIVIAPNGEEFENDDYEGDLNRSRLSLDLTLSGAYEVLVTSFGSGETGAYTLEINTEDELEGEVTLDEIGRLEAGDEVQASGEFIDSFEIVALPGQLLTISLKSEDFDTYLIVKSPSGEFFSDDDSLGFGSNSLLEIEAAEFGTFDIQVTSYFEEETGEYALQVVSSIMDIPNFE
ncbi:hypothetical protein JYT97_00920 [Haliea sp. AH-315-K21]|nr:hypothetical protein [Haliea sp. AH-315-K21]MBN4075500.1 hypothetical protein [Gammaproteobacteria bacterium AH-315-E17]